MSEPHSGNWVPAYLAAALTFFGGIWGLLTAWARLKASPPAEVTASQAHMAVALNEQAELMLARQDQRIAKLETRLEGVEAENRQCRLENEALRQDIAKLHGENADLREQVSTLQQAVRDQGIASAAREAPGTFIAIEGDKTMVMTPLTRRSGGRGRTQE
jgi:septal ring factor EnvC (AmiA/AmiB activator)